MIKELVKKLPEIYQKVYGYPEFDDVSSRNCDDRVEIIKNVIEKYKVATQKEKVRVLDLGCAQGYFDFKLCEQEIEVHGVDFCKENIDLCKAIREEKSMDCQFTQEEISIDYVKNLKSNEYDVVIFLNVLHHIAFAHNYLYARHMLELLVNKFPIVILELALKDEPVYWNVALPTEYERWFNNIYFYDEIEMFETHLSTVKRPFVICSNKYVYLENNLIKIEKIVNQAYAAKCDNVCRKYVFGDEKFVKIYRQMSERDRTEITNEIAFLTDYSDFSFTPKHVKYSINEKRVLLLYDALYGENLFDYMQEGNGFSQDGVKQIWKSILCQLIELEEKGLYMRDMRPWNILLDENGEAKLIDFGDISGEKRDILPKNKDMDIYALFIYLMIECEVGIVCEKSYDPLRFPHIPSICDIPEHLKMLLILWHRVSSGDKTFSKLKDLWQSIIDDGVIDGMPEKRASCEIEDIDIFLKQEGKPSEIVLYGAGKQGKELLNILGNRVASVVDSYKIGGAINGIVIEEPCECCTKSDVTILISVSNSEAQMEIFLKLISLGVDRNNIYVIKDSRMVLC